MKSSARPVLRRQQKRLGNGLEQHLRQEHNMSYEQYVLKLYEQE